jgi:glutamate transport system permease protein
MSQSVLYDVPGPVARRRTVIWSIVVGVLVAAVLVVVLMRLADNSQLDAEKWTPFVELEPVRRILLEGLRATLIAAFYGTIFAMILGTLLGVGRMSAHRWISRPCVLVIEVFRALPLLLLMFWFFLGVPALTNGAVIAELVRAGVLALPRGQREAAYAIGLRRSQAMRLILLPQAFRIMLPALISQLVVLLKDSTLGFIIGYRDLLEKSGVIRRQLHIPLQVYIVVAVIFILVNSLLSWLAHWVEGRQRRKFGARARTADDITANLERGAEVAVTTAMAEHPPDGRR